MRLKPFFFFILLLSFFSYDAIAANGQAVTDDDVNFSAAYNIYITPVPGYPESNTVTDRLLPFWELPTYVQVIYISIICVAMLGILGSVPFVLSRLKHALENPRTRDIFHFIQKNPGVTIAELSEGQNINRGTLKYHLSQLLSNNKIVFIRKGKFSRLFYNTSSPEDREGTISRYLKNENSSRILFKIMDNPGISNQELSDGFNLAKSTTHEYLKSFSDDGLVEFRQDGRFKRCYLKQDTRMIMLRYRPL